MKKIASIVICSVMIAALFGCGVRTTENGPSVADGTDTPEDNEVIDTENTEPSDAGEVIVIDSASLDIDNDGVYEDCTMTNGPTSGLFTVVITASVEGTVKYKNIFNLVYGELSFDEKDGIAQFVRDGEYHRLSVEDGIIVIDDLDPRYEGYWGDPEWHYNLR